MPWILCVMQSDQSPYLNRTQTNVHMSFTDAGCPSGDKAVTLNYGNCSNYSVIGEQITGAALHMETH